MNTQEPLPVTSRRGILRIALPLAVALVVVAVGVAVLWTTRLQEDPPVWHEIGTPWAHYKITQEQWEELYPIFLEGEEHMDKWCENPKSRESIVLLSALDPTYAIILADYLDSYCPEESLWNSES